MLSCRTVFISDVHLGTRGCQAGLLLEFLEQLDCERLYLIGDILDGWKLRSGWSWPDTHTEVVQKVLAMARAGVDVVYVPGNHDDRLREFCGVHLGGIVVARDAVHQGADGRRYLVTHGDEFDGIVSHAKWLAFLGDYAYRALLAANTRWNGLRHRLGLGYWSLSAYVKRRVKTAACFIDDFERALSDEARRRGVDGVICGHIHHAEMRDIDGVLYVNDGDWVESCTAAVERRDGKLELVHWTTRRQAAAGRRLPDANQTPARAPQLQGV